MIKSNVRLILLSLLAGIIVFGLGLFIDALVIHDRKFSDLFSLKLPPHSFLSFSLFIASFMVFGLLVANNTGGNRLAEQALRSHLAAMEAAMDGMAIFGPDGRHIYLNQAYAQINGYDSTAELIGKTKNILYDEKEFERIEREVIPVIEKKKQWRGELIGKRRDGSACLQEVSVATIEGGKGGRVCVVHDITKRKRDEEKLRKSERFLSTIFDSIRDPFSIIDRTYKIVRVNEAYAQMKNRPSRDFVGKKCYEVLRQRDSVCDGCVVEKTFLSGDPCAKEKLATFPDGSLVNVEIYTYPIIDDKGRASHVIEYTRDVTDRRKSEEERTHLIAKLEYLSMTDGLTGLLNRRALIDMLRHEMNKASRYGSNLALMLCDVDDFKKINDTYGHTAGDRALMKVSETLNKSLRKADIVGRYGGDEFMMILPETSIEGAANLAEKIRLLIEKAETEISEDARLTVSLSIGVTGFRPASDVEDLDSLVTRADNALYASKQTGKNKVSAH